MASSYVEVKETGNDENVLPFGLEACDENGILTSQLDDLPKDHTYTKEPDIVQDDKTDDISEQPEDAVESKPAEKMGRSQRNVKPHKFIKAKDTKVKKEVIAKKESPVKPAKKVATKPAKGVVNRATVNSKREEAAPAKLTFEEALDLESALAKAGSGAASEKIPEQTRGKRKVAKKRKIEEKENIAVKPPSLDVAAIENNAANEDVAEIEKQEKPSKNAEATPPSSPRKKRKIAVKEKIIPKKVAKIKNSPVPVSKQKTDAGNDHTMPAGWTRKVVIRKSGKSAGMADVYIYSPDGIKFRSRPDIAAYLARTKSNLKLDDFNFKRSVGSEVTSKPAKAVAKKTKSPPAKSKSKVTAEKSKKATSTPAKKGQKIVVKLKFSPPNKRSSKNSKQAAEQSSAAKKSKATKSVTKASGNSQKGKKKKTG